jgi:hypothetical protein
MVGEKISFSCVYCSAINKIDKERIDTFVSRKKPAPVICGNCARLQNGKSIKISDQQGHAGENYLECIPYKGGLKDVPAGPGENVAGVIKWRNTRGDLLTRPEFIFTHGLDPLTYWYKLNKIDQAFGHEVMIGETPVIKLGK